MTDLSDLLGGGGSQRAYGSGGGIFPRWPDVMSFWLTAGRDYLVPFRPRANVEVSDIMWLRRSADVATVYLAIYNESGTRVSDAVSDTDTTIGMHEVSITNITLTADTLYYIAINTTAASPVASHDISTSDALNGAFMREVLIGELVNFDIYSGGTVPSGHEIVGASYKTRAAAAMPASLTMTGFAGTGITIALGVKVA